MDLTAYRENPREQARIDSLLRLIPLGESVLDIGTRDGYFAKKLASTYERVTALDLEEPKISHPKIEPVKGDVASLQFTDNSFDTVLCAEVLEHLPRDILKSACNELARVTRHSLVIGVPYKQDIRVGRTTCQRCGAFNPPWGHINVFDQEKLQELFQGMKLEQLEFVGENRVATNGISAMLMDYAGNPFGTYGQDEPCISCGHKLNGPPVRNFPQRICTRIAHMINSVQRHHVIARPNWIHVRFIKNQHLI